MADLNEELRRLRLSARPPISARAMAIELGVTSSAYHFYESKNGFKQPVLPLQLARKLADILEPRGVARAHVMRLAGVEDAVPEGLSKGEKAWIVLWRAMSPGQRRMLVEQACTVLGWQEPEGEPDIARVLEHA